MRARCTSCLCELLRAAKQIGSCRRVGRAWCTSCSWWSSWCSWSGGTQCNPGRDAAACSCAAGLWNRSRSTSITPNCAQEWSSALCQARCAHTSVMLSAWTHDSQFVAMRSTNQPCHAGACSGASRERVETTRHCRPVGSSCRKAIEAGCTETGRRRSQERNGIHESERKHGIVITMRRHRVMKTGYIMDCLLDGSKCRHASASHRLPRLPSSQHCPERKNRVGRY